VEAPVNALNLEWLSIIDCPQVSYGARYGLTQRANVIAAHYRHTPERLFNDLDYFDIIVARCGDVVLGFRSYLHAPGQQHCHVSVWPRDADDAIDLIANIARVRRDDVLHYPEPW
jgi:hypothetical protein